MGRPLPSGAPDAIRRLYLMKLKNELKGGSVVLDRIAWQKLKPIPTRKVPVGKVRLVLHPGVFKNIKAEDEENEELFKQLNNLRESGKNASAKAAEFVVCQEIANQAVWGTDSYRGGVLHTWKKLTGSYDLEALRAQKVLEEDIPELEDLAQRIQDKYKKITPAVPVKENVGILGKIMRIFSRNKS